MPRTYTDEQRPRKGGMSSRWLIMNGKGPFRKTKGFGKNARSRGPRRTPRGEE